MDFNGRNNRYGQVAVPDFIEHLALQAPSFFNGIKTQVTSQLQCDTCHWVSQRESSDILLKLYLPQDVKNGICLSDLMVYNASSALSGREAVFCGTCSRKTSQTCSRDYSSDVILIEVIRVSDLGGSQRWSKNSLPISFSTRNLNLAGLVRSYRVAASCHHTGSIGSGHWVTKVCTAADVWYKLDDLTTKSSITDSPGVSDSSVVVLLLVAEDKLIH